VQIKRLAFLLPIAALVTLACVGPSVPTRVRTPKGAWTLDADDSIITATALKNGKKKVPVSFTGLRGWADASAGSAEISIPLIYLSTGDGVRDFNVKNQFFEVNLRIPAHRDRPFRRIVTGDSTAS
jgi:polyisoprenoid-binding protein YceI